MHAKSPLVGLSGQDAGAFVWNRGVVVSASISRQKLCILQLIKCIKVAARLNNVTVSDLVLIMKYILESCIVLSAFCVPVLMSALLFHRLSCWIIDHRLWFETLASSDQEVSIIWSYSSLCARASEKQGANIWCKWYSQNRQVPNFLFRMTFRQGKDMSVTGEHISYGNIRWETSKYYPIWAEFKWKNNNDNIHFLKACYWASPKYTHILNICYNNYATVSFH